jgi:uncharacterized delta-60 repeat protein
MLFPKLTHIIASVGLVLTLTCLKVEAAPGDLDPTFDPGQVLWQGLDFPAFKYAAVLQSDGKVVIGGRFDTVAGVSRIFMARLNSNGSLDTTFNAPLQIFVNGGVPDGEVYDILLQPDGKFLVCGYFLVGGVYKTVVRLNNDGTLDSSFNVTTNGGSTDSNLVYRMLLQSDGKIVIASNSLQSVNGVVTNRIARLTSTGGLDAALGVDGNVTFGVFALALQADGKIVVAGSGGVVTRLNSDGTEDVGWTYPNIGSTAIDSLAMEADGQIIVGGRGRLTVNGNLTDGLIRLNPSGSIDLSFNPPDVRTALSLYVQPDGKIAVGGQFTANFGALLSNFGRLNPDGSLDFMSSSGPDNDVFDIARQSDGKFIAVGAFENFNQGNTPIPRTGVVRIFDAGSPVPPLAGRIVFDSRPTPTVLEIDSMNPDGTNRTPLTTTGFDYGPSVSADGSKIAFISLRDNTSEEIYIMNGDGSGQTRLTTDNAVDLDPSITADGTKITFASLRDGNWEIYTMNSSGGNLQRVTTNTFRDEQPSFSPDGSKIVFRSNRDGDPEIYVMNADGSGQTRLTTDTANDFEPAFSPDGTKIVWRSSRDGNFEIYSMNVNGTNQVRLTNNAAIDSDPAYSPDGSRIAFVTQRDGNAEIYYMNADGSNPTRITNNAFEDGRPSWGGVFSPTPPVLKVNIAGGNVLVGSPGAGIILRSPNGTVCIKIGIDNVGGMTTTITPCP